MAQRCPRTPLCPRGKGDPSGIIGWRLNRPAAAVAWGLIAVVALGAVLLALFDWAPAVWIVLSGLAGLGVFRLLGQIGVISLVHHEDD